MPWCSRKAHCRIARMPEKRRGHRSVVSRGYGVREDARACTAPSKLPQQRSGTAARGAEAATLEAVALQSSRSSLRLTSRSGRLSDGDDPSHPLFTQAGFSTCRLPLVRKAARGQRQRASQTWGPQAPSGWLRGTGGRASIYKERHWGLTRESPRGLHESSSLPALQVKEPRSEEPVVPLPEGRPQHLPRVRVTGSNPVSATGSEAAGSADGGLGDVADELLDQTELSVGAASIPPSRPESREERQGHAAADGLGSTNSSFDDDISRTMSLAILRPLQFETTEESVERQVFDSLCHDGAREISRDKLCEALRKMSYRDVNPAWVEELASKVVSRASLLEFTEFRQFVDLYYARHVESLAEEYRQAASPRTGMLAVKELPRTLEQRGVLCCSVGIIKRLLREIRGDMNSEFVGLHDYIRLRELVQYRGGFTEQEAAEMIALFNRLDENGNGRMDVAEVESAIRWLGFDVGVMDATMEPEPQAMQGGRKATHLESRRISVACNLELNTDELLEGFDAQEGITSEDFLQVMRRRREAEISRVMDLFHKESLGKPNGTLSLRGACRIFEKLGYISVMQAAVEECAVARGVRSHHGMSFDDMYQLLQEFKACEGFLKADIDEYRRVFEKHDLDRSGAINVVELGGALRWLGFNPMHDQQQDLMDGVDLDNSGEIEFDEFLKVMRWFKEEEVRLLKGAFLTHDVNYTLNVGEVNCILAALGYGKLTHKQATIFNKATEGGMRELTFAECNEMLRALREQSREDFAKTQGYSDEELSHLREQFHRYDPRGDGFIGPEKMYRLVEENFPEATQTVEGQRKFEQIFNFIDSDRNGKLEWAEFLQLMRMLEDMRMYEQFLEEQEYAAKSGYHSTDVKGFRRIFRMCDSDATKSVSVEELLRLFATIVPLTNTLKEQLKNILAEVSKDGGQSLSFAEFLLMMRKVEDANLVSLSTGDEKS